VELLREGLLAGVQVELAGGGELGAPVGARMRELGAADGRGDVLVVDASARPADADGVRAALDNAWDAIRPVATEAMIEHGGGLIVLLAPRPGDAHAAAARAGLENLARTLSVEWARFEVRPVAVLPGAETAAAEVAELVGYLASPAGAYYSGCVFELGSVPAPPPRRGRPHR
jgi:NAD(P)-dependent dehydrogenase (short-subunit alcohol dehydrogenase family)